MPRELPERPLSAGKNASLHLGSFALELGISSREYRKIHPQFGRLESQIFSNKGQEALRPSAEILSLMAHEHDHMNRLTGTSFGFLLETVRSSRVRSTAKLISERLGSNRTLALPLTSPFPSAHGTVVEIVEALEASSSLESEAVRYRGLRDCLTSLLDEASGPELVSAAWALSGGNRRKIRSFFAGNDIPDCGGYQRVLNSNIIETLTARHVLELLAWRRQGETLIAFGYGLKEINRLVNETEYELAFDAWHTLVPKARKLFTEVGDELHLSWSESLPFELYACLDLALWPPFVPPGRLPPGVRWADVNPAIRLCKILTVFRKCRFPFHAKDEDEQDAWLRHIQATICQRLRWPTPQRLARRWCDYLREQCSAESNPWNELERFVTFRRDRAIAILTNRLQRPADVVRNYLTPEDVGGRSAPVCVFKLPRERKRISAFAKPEFELIFQMLVNEGLEHLATGRRSIIESLEHDWIARETAKQLASHLARHGDWTANVRRRFRAICEAFFVSSRRRVSSRSGR